MNPECTVLIADEVPISLLESIKLDTMGEFARSAGLEAYWGEGGVLQGISVYKENKRVLNGTFGENRHIGVIEYLTAMSQILGMYRIDILMKLLKMQHEEEQRLKRREQIISHGVFRRGRWVI